MPIVSAEPAPRTAPRGKPKDNRINVKVTPEAYDALEELGRMLRPTLKRPWGEIVDVALKETLERHRRDGRRGA